MQKIWILCGCLLAGIAVKSQNINWAHINDSVNQSAEAALLLEYGINFGVGYNYIFNGNFPVVLHGEISIPSGKNIFDDYKIKTGADVRLTQIGNVHVDIALHGITRSYASAFVRIFNFGSEALLQVGYYRPHWFLGANISYDKAIVSHFNHTEAYKGNYPDVVNGWYEPESGGNIKIGAKAGYHFGRNGIILQTGIIKTEEFSSSPLIPYYAGMTYTYSW